MKKVLTILLGLVLILAAVMIVRTLNFSTVQFSGPPSNPLPLDRDAAVERLSRIIRFRTISSQAETEIEREQFLALHDWLRDAYPAAHSVLEREVVNRLSLLYTWRGGDPSLKPALFMAHLDVVPVEPGTEADWSYPSFSGAVEEGFVWGRGSMDVKLGVTGALEAVEALIGAGYQPQRTILLAFGHDEEVGGDEGAGRIAALLRSRGIELEFVLDEGGVIMGGEDFGLSRPVALIGIAEKGYLSLELTARGAGGHSSMPPKHTSIGKLATAVHRLERRPFPARLRGATRVMFDFIAPEMPFVRRMIFANLWLFKPLVERNLTSTPETAAMLRTTTAATIFEASVKDNVIPQKARAVVNFRIIPGESVESVIGRVREIIDDPAIEIRPLAEGKNPSKISDVRSEAFQVLAGTTTRLFPEAIIAPYLVMGGTDSRHYGDLTDNIFRFIPAPFNREDLERIHGTNERQSIDDYMAYIQFLTQLIRNSQPAEPGSGGTAPVQTGGSEGRHP